MAKLRAWKVTFSIPLETPTRGGHRNHIAALVLVPDSDDGASEAMAVVMEHHPQAAIASVNKQESLEVLMRETPMGPGYEWKVVATQPARSGIVARPQWEWHFDLEKDATAHAIKLRDQDPSLVVRLERRARFLGEKWEVVATQGSKP